jgi:hypothetical protein
MKIYKIAAIVIAVFIIFGFAQISYADDLDIDASCPAKVAPGDPLDVSVTITNQALSGVFVRSAGTGIVGNPAGNNGFPVIYGPWNMPVNVSLPPGVSGPYTIRITEAVDASLDGTIAMATIILLDGNGWTVGGGACGVAVEP